MDNWMSSWSCGKSVSYDFCNTTDWYCSSNTDSNSGAGNIYSGLVGNNNFASALKLERYDPLVKPAVVLFQNKGCENKSGRYFADEKKRDNATKVM